MLTLPAGLARRAGCRARAGALIRVSRRGRSLSTESDRHDRDARAGAFGLRRPLSGDRLAQAAEQLAAEHAARENDIALAALVAERRRSLLEEKLVELDETARRVGARISALP